MFTRSLTKNQHRGFTLIELLVAVSLMAILSVIAWRGLDAVLKARDSLTEVGEDMRSLAITFSQIDEDLRRSWPVRQLLPNQPPIRFSPGLAGQGAQLELLREGGGALDGVRIERVAYRVREGQLERGFASYAAGASSQLAPFEWQPLLTAVSQMNLKAWVQGTGWVPAENLLSVSEGAAAQAPAVLTQPPAPTLGIDLQLTRSKGQIYTRVYSVRD